MQKNYLYYFFMLVLMFLFIEVSGRVLSYLIGHNFRNKTIFISPFFTGSDLPVPVFTDSSGIFNNNKEVLFKKRKNEIRVICIGGSTTKLGENDIPYSQELSKLFDNKHSNNINIINAGVNTFSSAHSLVNYSLRLSCFNPDIIILNNNVNDWTVGNYKSFISPDYSNKYLDNYYLGYRNWSGFKSFLMENSKATRILYWSVASFGNFIKGEDNYSIDQIKGADKSKNYFQRNMESLIILSKSNSTIPILLTQPHLDLDSAPKQSEYNQIILEIAKKHNVHCIDLAKDLSNNIDNFIDNVHYSEEGVKRISKNIYSKLLDIIE